LAAAIELDGIGIAGPATAQSGPATAHSCTAQLVLLSGGTDGGDGPTDAAGAIVDGHTAADARARGLDAREYLEAADAYHFFEGAGRGLLKTGPTGTNVMDVQLLLVGDPHSANE
jgi:glycerate-2-kinase